MQSVGAHIAAWGDRWPHLGYGLPEVPSERPPITWPQTAMRVRAAFAFGADPEGDPDEWSWTDVSDRLMTEDGVTVVTGRRNETSTMDPSSISCSLTNFDGYLTPRNPASPWPLRRNTPFRFAVNPGSGMIERFSGFVSSVEPRWLDKAQRIPVIRLEAGGITRRLGQGQTPLKSPIYRVVMSPSNATTVAHRLAYWPCEDASRSTQIASAVPGNQPLTITGNVSFANYNGVPGSESLLTLSDGAELTGVIPSYTSSEHKVTTIWGADAEVIPNGTNMMELYGTGTIDTWKLVFTVGGGLKIEGYANGVQINAVGPLAFGVDGVPFLTSMELTQTGGNINCRVYAQRITPDDPDVGSFGEVTFTGRTVGRITGFTIAPGGGLADVSVGHVTAVKDTSALGGTNSGLPAAIYGHAGETAAERLARLGDEEGVSVTVDSGATEEMSVQSTLTLVDLFRECEAADHGMLVEHGFGLRYIPRVVRRNAPVALPIDVPTGQLADEPKPIEDDQGIRNDVKATRPGGSSARYEDTDHIATDGRYDHDAQVNVPDEDLDHHAEWLAHLGTVDEMRYPQLQLNLAAPRSGNLIEPYATTGLGGRAQVTNLPAAHIPNGLDVFVEGYTETIGPYAWDVVANCSPARPHEVWTVASNTFGRVDTGGATLSAAIDADDTSLSVASSGALWTTSAADLPLDIEVINTGATEGERMRVTAISGASSPQALTVTRSINGVAVAHASGSTVRLWRPGQISL